MSDIVKYRKIKTILLHDERVIPLPSDYKLVYIGLIICFQSNRVGLYRLYVNQLAEDLGLTVKVVKDAINELCRVGLIEFDHALSVVWVKGMVKHDPPTADSSMKAMATIIQSAPKCMIRDHLIEHIQELADTAEQQNATNAGILLKLKSATSLAERWQDSGRTLADGWQNAESGLPIPIPSPIPLPIPFKDKEVAKNGFDEFLKRAKVAYSKTGSNIGSPKEAREEWVKLKFTSMDVDRLADILDAQANGKVEGLKHGKTHIPSFRNLNRWLKHEMWHEPVWQAPVTTKITDYQPLTEDEMAWKPRTKQP